MPLLGLSRGELKDANNIGYVSEKLGVGGVQAKEKARLYRSPRLESILKYYEDRAYDHLQDWHKASSDKDNHVKFRDRKPFMRVNLPKILASRLASKLVGHEVFPTLSIAEDPDTQYYFRLIMTESGIDSKLVGAIRSLCAMGSMFLRFYVVGSKIKLQYYNSNYCYPFFDEEDELEFVRVQYVYTDHDDLDDKGNAIKKWYLAEFSKDSDVLYDNPVYDPKTEPVFEVVSEVKHNFGFVQGEWFKTSEEHEGTPDGMSLVYEAIPFQDAINYSLSLSQESTDYNTSPQLGLHGMDEEDIEQLLASSAVAWNMGREGRGEFIESSMTGVNASMDMRDKNRVLIQDLTRVIMMDPEKMVAQAQSGKALEVLHGPMIDLINEIRPQLETHLKSIILKMGIANILVARAIGRSPVFTPPGWLPKDLNIVMEWPPVFPMTTQDLIQFTQLVVSACNNNLISRKTGTKQLAKYFNIEDVDAEVYDVENQKSLNPFGMF